MIFNPTLLRLDNNPMPEEPNPSPMLFSSKKMPLEVAVDLESPTQLETCYKNHSKKFNKVEKMLKKKLNLLQENLLKPLLWLMNSHITMDLRLTVMKMLTTKLTLANLAIQPKEDY